jgi:hypothetical protein
MADEKNTEQKIQSIAIEETFSCAKCEKVLGYTSKDYFRQTANAHNCYMLCSDCRKKQETREFRTKRLQENIEIWIEEDTGLSGYARATYTLVETKVKCDSCGNKWKIERRIDDDFDSDIECPDCLFATSAWNFIPEYEDREGMNWNHFPQEEQNGQTG